MFSKDTVESKLELSIKSLKRLGMLRPGYRGTLRWTSCRTGEEKGSIGIRTSAYKIDLIYRSRSWGGEWESVEESIYLTETYPNFGGKRIWFRCPSCHSRRAKLYGGKYYRCRACYDLCYESQLETGAYRIMGKMYKIRHRLNDYYGLDEWFPPKPKGMRWKTYNALKAQYDDLERQLNLAWAKRFGMYLDILD